MLKKTNFLCAMLMANGDLFCRIADVFIMINQKGKFVPFGIEISKNKPIGVAEWLSAKGHEKELILLNKEQVEMAKKAIEKREEYLIARSKIIKFIDLSPKALDILKKMELAVLFETLKEYLMHFECTEKNQGFRNMLGFVIFGTSYKFIDRFSPEKQNELIKLFKVFNPKPCDKLSEIIRFANTVNNNKIVSESKTIGAGLNFDSIKNLKMVA